MEYNLTELLKNPDASLTKDQYDNWDKYMRPCNDDKDAREVDISEAVNSRIAEIKKNGTYWI